MEVDWNQSKQKLLKQLAEKTEKEYQARCYLAHFAISRLTIHIVLFVTEKNLREGRDWAKKMIKFLDVVFREGFHFWLILFVLVWVVAL